MLINSQIWAKFQICFKFKQVLTNTEQKRALKIHTLGPGAPTAKVRQLIYFEIGYSTVLIVFNGPGVGH